MATSFIDRENRTIRDLLKEARKYPILLKEEEEKLVIIAQSGDAGAQVAKDRLVNCNLRYIISKANKLSSGNVEMMDLVQEGSFGLIDAINHFDCSKNVRFLTYATNWIEKRMREYVAAYGQCVILPDDGMKVRSKVNKARRDFVKTYGYEPSYEELAEIIGMKASRIEAIMNCSDNKSFDAPMGGEGDDDDRTLRDKFVDSDNQGADQKAHESILAQHIAKLLSHLKGNERVVIELQYGLGNNLSLSLREIASRLGIAHETVRKASIRAHAKLKALVPAISTVRIAC